MEGDGNNTTSRHLLPIYSLLNLSVTGIIPRLERFRIRNEISPWKCNLMASSEDGQLLFLALGDKIEVHRIEREYSSSKNPPPLETVFPSQPWKILSIPRDLRERYNSQVEGEEEEQILQSLDWNYIRRGRTKSFGEVLVAVNGRGIILVWSIREIAKGDCKPVAIIENTNEESTWGIAVSPEHDILAISSNAREITFYDLKTKERLSNSLKHGHNIPSIDFSTDGQTILSASIDKTFKVCKFADPSNHLIRQVSEKWGWMIRGFKRNHIRKDYSSDPMDLMVKKRYFCGGVEGISESSDDEDENLLASGYLEQYAEREGAEEMSGFENNSELAMSEDALIREDELPWTRQLNEEMETWPSDDDENDPGEDQRRREEVYREHLEMEQVNNDDDEFEGEDEDEDEDVYSWIRQSPGSSLEEVEREETAEGSNEEESEQEKETSPVYSVEYSSEERPDCDDWFFYLNESDLFVFDAKNPESPILKVKDLVEVASSSVHGNGDYTTLYGNTSCSWPFNRLVMAEWIPELSVLLIGNQMGFLIVVDLFFKKDELRYSCFTVPSPSLPVAPLAGFTVIPVTDFIDNEPVKYHIWMVQYDGIVRCFELTRQLQL